MFVSVYIIHPNEFKLQYKYYTQKQHSRFTQNTYLAVAYPDILFRDPVQDPYIKSPLVKFVHTLEAGPDLVNLSNALLCLSMNSTSLGKCFLQLKEKSKEICTNSHLIFLSRSEEVCNQLSYKVFGKAAVVFFSGRVKVNFIN